MVSFSGLASEAKYDVECMKNMTASSPPHQLEAHLKIFCTNESSPIKDQYLAEQSNKGKAWPDMIPFVNKAVAPTYHCKNNDMNGRNAAIRNLANLITDNSESDSDSDESASGVSGDLAENFEKLGGNAKALEQALCFMGENEGESFQGSNGSSSLSIDKCKLAINDFVSSEPKMFMMNKCTGEVTAMAVTIGYGGVGNSTGKTTPGFHIMGGEHVSPSGKVWSPGIKIHGIQKGVNDSAWERGVVVHQALGRVKGTSDTGGYCSGGSMSSDEARDKAMKCSGKSAGCPAVDPESWDEVKEHLTGDSDKGGPLLYNYTASENEKGNDYCGDNLWK